MTKSYMPSQGIHSVLTRTDLSRQGEHLGTAGTGALFAFLSDRGLASDCAQGIHELE